MDVFTFPAAESFELPSGFRFQPTERELVVDYLKNKIFKNPLPCSVIIELNVYDYHPQQLCDLYMREGETAMYFFSPRNRKYQHGKRPNRKADQGFWKASGASSPIKINNATEASKMTLVYHTGDNLSSVKTGWMMHEYVMEQYSIPAKSKPGVKRKSPIASSSNAVSADNNKKLDNWVLCKVYNKAWKSKNKNEPTGCNATSELQVPTNAVNLTASMQKSIDEVKYGSFASPLMQGTHEDQFVSNPFEPSTQIIPRNNLQHCLSQVFSTNFSPGTQSGLHVGSSSSAPAMQGTIGGVATDSGGGSTNSGFLESDDLDWETLLNSLTQS